MVQNVAMECGALHYLRYVCIRGDEADVEEQTTDNYRCSLAIDRTTSHNFEKEAKTTRQQTAVNKHQLL